MNAIHIRKKLDSDTLHLPELRPFVGKTVEITVVEELTESQVTPGIVDWDAAMEAARSLENYDFDAWQGQREYDLQHAKDHLP